MTVRVFKQVVQSRRLASPIIIFLGRLFFSRKRHTLPTTVRRVLFLKFGALGDVLMTTPLLKAVRQRYPAAHLTYATGSWSDAALANNPHLNRLVTFADSLSWWRRVLALGQTMWQLRRERYDIIFVLDRAWQAGAIAAYIGGYRIGFDRLGEGFALHQAIPYGSEPHEQAPHDIDTYLALGRIIGCAVTDQDMVLLPTPGDMAWAASQLPGHIPWIALCPGGARNQYQPMAARRWPVEYFIELGQRIAADGYGIVLLGSDADQVDARHIFEQLTPQMLELGRVINLTGLTTFSQAAAVLARCRAAVVADTALMHVASAAHTPTVALFGPTNPRRKAPLGHYHCTIWNATPCVRCGEIVCHWESVAPHPETVQRMQLISPEAVNAALASLLKTHSQERKDIYRLTSRRRLAMREATR